jgi:replicative DNA helicase
VAKTTANKDAGSPSVGTAGRETQKRTQSGVEPLGRAPRDVEARCVPESLAAEAAVLGSMVIDPACIGEVIEYLGTDGANAFYRLENQILYDALVHLYDKNRGRGVDAVLLRDELEKRKQVESIGGVAYIARILESVPSSANVMYYARILKDKQMLRELITAASEILDSAHDITGATEEKLDTAEQKIFSITDRKITGQASAIKDLITSAYELIEKRSSHHVTGLATGFYELDELTCGLQNGEMIVVAGRPSMGKTSFALNIAEYIGVFEQQPVAIFSLEMGRQQLAERFLCSNSKTDSQLMRKGMLTTEHYQRLVESCGRLSEARIFIDDSAGITPLEMRAKARRLKARHDIKVCLVDYMQLMSLGTGRVESRQQEITAISRYLKAMARELDIPVVVISQLNRAPEGREGHRPRMSDLRESGSIEQDADVVMLLHREDYYHRGEADYQDDNTAEVIIAKQRNGPTGAVKLTFFEQFTRFEPYKNVSEPF